VKLEGGIRGNGKEVLLNRRTPGQVIHTLGKQVGLGQSQAQEAGRKKTRGCGGGEKKNHRGLSSGGKGYPKTEATLGSRNQANVEHVGLETS